MKDRPVQPVPEYKSTTCFRGNNIAITAIARMVSASKPWINFLECYICTSRNADIDAWGSSPNLTRKVLQIARSRNANAAIHVLLGPRSGWPYMSYTPVQRVSPSHADCGDKVPVTV